MDWLLTSTLIAAGLVLFGGSAYPRWRAHRELLRLGKELQILDRWQVEYQYPHVVLKGFFDNYPVELRLCGSPAFSFRPPSQLSLICNVKQNRCFESIEELATIKPEVKGLRNYVPFDWLASISPSAEDMGTLMTCRGRRVSNTKGLILYRRVGFKLDGGNIRQDLQLLKELAREFSSD